MPIPEQILIVAERLGQLREDVVFLGGMVRELLVTDPVVPGRRFTKFSATLPWHLPPDAIGQSRLSLLEKRLRELSELEILET